MTEKEIFTKDIKKIILCLELAHGNLTEAAKIARLHKNPEALSISQLINLTEDMMDKILDQIDQKPNI